MDTFTKLVACWTSEVWRHLWERLRILLRGSPSIASDHGGLWERLWILLRGSPSIAGDHRTLWERLRILLRGSPSIAGDHGALWERLRILLRGSPSIAGDHGALWERLRILLRGSPSIAGDHGALWERLRILLRGSPSIAGDHGVLWERLRILLQGSPSIAGCRGALWTCCGIMCKGRPILSRGSSYLVRALAVKKSCPDPGGGANEIRHHWVSGYTTNKQMAENQLQDADLGKVIGWLGGNGKPSRDEVAVESPVARQLWLMWDQLKLAGGILFRKFESSDGATYDQLVVPWSLKKKVLHSVHDSVVSGHLGVKKTISKAKK